MEALRRSEQRYVRAARGANDGLWDWDLPTGEIYFSQRWKEMLGLASDEEGCFDQWLKRIHIDGHMSFLAAVRANLAGRTPYFEHEHRMLHADGEYRWMLCRGLAARDGSAAPSRMAGSQTDVTDRHVAAEQLRHAALHDALTRLPNRALFTQLLEHAVLRARRHEFTMLVDDMQSADDAHDVATRIQQALKPPFNIPKQEIHVAVSIGVAIGAAGCEGGEGLLRDADVAMYPRQNAWPRAARRRRRRRADGSGAPPAWPAVAELSPGEG